MKISHAIGLFVTFSSFATVLLGEVITPPPGLERGDQYRLAFITSAVTDATTRGRAFYDQIVLDAVNSTPLGAVDVQWQAMVNAGPGLMLLSTDIDVPIYRVDGQLLPTVLTCYFAVEDCDPILQ